MRTERPATDAVAEAEMLDRVVVGILLDDEPLARDRHHSGGFRDPRDCGGLLAQGLRWISLSLMLKDEDSAWRITFLKDPKDLPTKTVPSSRARRAGVRTASEALIACSL